MTITYEIENGKKVNVKTYDDGEEAKYDERGNVIYFKDIFGYEGWFEYDERGNVIHLKDNKGREWWREYDDRGNVIHEKNNKGREWFAKDYEQRKVC